MKGRLCKWRIAAVFLLALLSTACRCSDSTSAYGYAV